MAPSIKTPSLNHVTEGVGTPETVQVRLIACPALPVVGNGGSISEGGVLVITEWDNTSLAQDTHKMYIIFTSLDSTDVKTLPSQAGSSMPNTPFITTRYSVIPSTSQFLPVYPS